jgi:WD40 repeat protein
MASKASLIVLGSLISVTSFAQSPRPDIRWFVGGHLTQVVSASYSPDGKLIGSTGSDDSEIKLWSTADGSMVRTLLGSDSNPFIFGPMQPVTFMPDGKTVIAIGEGAAIGFWNVADGRLLRTVNLDGNDLAVSPDGTLIAVGTRSNTVKLVRFSDGAVVRVLTGPTAPVYGVAFSPDGTSVACGDSDGGIHSWRTSDGAPILGFQGHSAWVNTVAFSADGTLIASGGGDKVVRLWSSTSGAPAGSFVGHSETIQDLEFSQNGRWLASASWDETVRLWDLSLGTSAGVLHLTRSGNSVAFDPSSTRLLVAAGFDLQEWDIPSLSPVRNLIHNWQQITGTQFTPDGAKLVASSYDATITVRDTQSGALQRTIQTPFGVNCLGLDNVGARAAVGVIDRTVRLYGLADGSPLATLNPGTYTYSLAFSPNGAVLASGHLDNVVRLWNTGDWSNWKVLAGHTDQINGLAYTSDGSMLLSASEDGTVRVWDSQGNFVRALSAGTDSLTSLAISPDNQLALAGSSTGKVYLWRISTGALIYAFGAHGFRQTNCVRFTHNGDAFYTGGGGDRHMKLWRTSDHAILADYTVETAGMSSGFAGPQRIDVSPDGHWVAYGRDDATTVLAHNSLMYAPTSATVVRGTLAQGSSADLRLSDDVSMSINSAQDVRDAPVILDVVSQVSIQNPRNLSFILEAGASTSALTRQVWMQNFQTGQLEMVESGEQGSIDQSIRIDLGSNFSRFIDAGGNVHARIKWGPAARAGWQIRIDQAMWSAGLQ